MIAHAATAAWHLSGLPPHRPPQQSSFVAHVAPVAAQTDVQTATPASPASHEPLQHVSPAPHGVSRGKHPPAPNPHRPNVASQVPQHGGTVTDPAQLSPSARHSAAARMQTPSVASHFPEQHSTSTAHALPATAQTVPPHWPPLHPSEQQSEASVHAVPSTRQYGVHSIESAPTGSHRPLQHVLRFVQLSPAPLHEPAFRHTAPSHRPEQQSDAEPHPTPSARHSGPGPQVTPASFDVPASGALTSPGAMASTRGTLASTAPAS